jgi:hydrogenase/urease accessory protein HupE
LTRLWLLLVWLAFPVHAHEVRPAFLQITELEPGHFEVIWKQPTLADRRLPIDPVLPDGCASSAEAYPEHTGSALIQRWETSCDLRSGTLAIQGLSATLTDVMVRISYLDGDVLSRLLRPSEPALDLADPTPGTGGYFALGVEHLLLGIDHILFVIGLVLFIRSPWMLVKTVTAFTVAHSITLALSVVGLVTLPSGPVEAVIALSILYLARELMLPETARSPLTRAAPWLMAFAFGLLHGFGFAGALTDIGLPREQLAASLLLFNLGIEAGQLLIVAALLIGAWLTRRLLGKDTWRLRQAFTVAMGCAAAFWTIDRVVALLVI